VDARYAAEVVTCAAIRRRRAGAARVNPRGTLWAS
jgi:hypothetical protein